MKIVAGLGSIEDYPLYADAGADEVFVGYSPSYWAEAYGADAPINRREVIFYNVQIGSYSELEILRDMAADRRVPVSIALNAVFYHPGQYPVIGRMVSECMELDFCTFIIADPGLYLYLVNQEWEKEIHLTISGETGEMNPSFVRMLSDSDIKRLIFHRKMAVSEMKDCIEIYQEESMKSRKNMSMEFEAFLLNENCHFHGGFCNSFHCDELCHMCQVPYVQGNRSGSAQSSKSVFPDEKEGDGTDSSMVTGVTGCGLCALWDLEKAGISHLKIVGRGNYTEAMVRDINAVKQALEILAISDSGEYYMERMKKTLFPNGCSGNCYYHNLTDF